MIVTVVVCFLLPHICGLDQDVTEITAVVEFACLLREHQTCATSGLRSLHAETVDDGNWQFKSKVPWL
jgi:hypothetical protein